MKKILLLLVAVCLTGHATLMTVSKIGTEIKGFKTPTNLGLLFGWRYMHHRSESFAVGGAAYTGQLSQGATGSFSYGGLAASYNANLSNHLGVEVGLVAGGAGGFDSTGTNVGGILLEPTLTINFFLGRYVRAGLNGGYAWMPSSQAFSAISVGLRFDFLSVIDSDPKSNES